MSRWRDLAQEVLELGPAGFAFRVRWELALRTGLTARLERPPSLPPSLSAGGATFADLLPFAAATSVRAAIAPLLAPGAAEALVRRAEAAILGRIRCFGRWEAAYGDPIDWHLNPVTGQRWNAEAHWSEVLADTGRAGDVKLTWEGARVPHAFDLARAAGLGLLPPQVAAGALARQIEGFLASSRFGHGVHWASGQEIVVRLVAWLFASSVLGDEAAMRAARPAVARHLYEGGVHLERHIDYARKAITNNHLVSEAFGLLLAGTLLPEAPRAERWRTLGMELLTAQAVEQFYPDGGYLMSSHNYHRAALQPYLLALALRRRCGAPVPAAWTAAMERSLDFLAARQYPADGRLPNFGSNDGALPLVLSSCDYGDFRPLLQTLSLATRGERRYPPGPWDEEAAWLLGPAALDAPLREAPRVSVSSTHSGQHLLHGRAADTLATFRCGSLHHRFTQIDMLHVDVLWRGHDVLADGGTYLYNGPPEWHRHFTGGESHNTITVDGRDQMVHHRRFKVLYLTRARLLRFEDAGDHVLAEGEHTGFQRFARGCVHRRSVLHVKDDLWVVVDRVGGEGRHQARLHWLCGAYPHRYERAAGRLALETPAGPFTVTVLDPAGHPAPGEVVAGQEQPPRGWLSRYYGEKVPVASLAVVVAAEAPLTLVTVLAGGTPEVTVAGDRWHVAVAGRGVRFRIGDGRLTDVAVGP